ncbi:PTS-dependent dihydroxyacetone kinase 1, dihydroxyacetone-binding subunit DhaK [Anabrus simplex]|uniref:PTS-dependent dihydroxyacetone kinase 1, dihydroxyacetone-binding subunit DhaK n=1 Tax=Anabrus simplex TaxID=316456 RepID=UPI0035A2CE19
MEGSKKLINSPDTCVDQMLAGVVGAHPSLLLHTKKRVVQQRNWDRQRGIVGLISGGGSGHEPFCAGYVGHGMLAAISAGSVFASPPAYSVVHAIRCIATDNPGGALVIIPNYTGDCLNFGLAVMQARNEGLKVQSVVVGEDCALLSSQHTSSAGRRGMCGLLFVYKICGSLAEQGLTLDELHDEAEKVITCMSTLGVSLSSCSLPGAGPLFTLQEDEMELGLGVHGEAGIERLKVCSADEVVGMMLDRLLSSLSLSSGEDVAVLVNNLGASSQLEQWLMCGLVQQQLKARDITVHRIYAGHLMTSLDMAGIQVSILKLPPEVKDKWLGCLDDITDAPAWPGSPASVPVESILAPKTSRDFISIVETEPKIGGPILNEEQCKLLKSCLKAVSESLEAEETKLNELDSGAGDGDCGSTLRRLTEGILKSMDKLTLDRPAVMFQELAHIAESSMGGTSGAIYSLLFMTASNALHKMDQLTAENWGLVWKSGLDGVMSYSNARPGDRTMLDALVPACELYLSSPKETASQTLLAVEQAVAAAIEGCSKTKDMVARAGRASYVSEALVTDFDAGAYGVTVWLRAILDALQRKETTPTTKYTCDNKTCIKK